MKISGTYTPLKWDEVDYLLVSESMKSTRASVELQFVGDIEGLATVEYLMYYTSYNPTDQHSSQAQYVGQIRILGTLHGMSGSFALNDSGTFSGGAASSRIQIISGSGTNELSAISGHGSYLADQSGCTWEMEVNL